MPMTLDQTTELVIVRKNSIYIVSHRKSYIIVLLISSSNIDRFLKSVHCPQSRKFAIKYHWRSRQRRIPVLNVKLSRKHNVNMSRKMLELEQGCVLPMKYEAGALLGKQPA